MWRGPGPLLQGVRKQGPATAGGEGQGTAGEDTLTMGFGTELRQKKREVAGDSGGRLVLKFVPRPSGLLLGHSLAPQDFLIFYPLIFLLA